MKNHTTRETEKAEEINRFFHVMNGVSVPKGCEKNERGEDTYTAYTCCADRENLTYYFTTYENPAPREVTMTLTSLHLSGIKYFDM